MKHFALDILLLDQIINHLCRSNLPYLERESMDKENKTINSLHLTYSIRVETPKHSVYFLNKPEK